MRYLPRALLAGGLGFATSFIAACGGGSGLLSGDQAGRISNGLDQVSSAVQANNCPAAASAGSALRGQIENLPATVNSTLRSDLTQGVSTVSQLAQVQCHKPATTPTTASTAATTASTVTSTPTASTATTPTTTPSTPPATTPASPGSTSTQPTGGGGLSGGGGGGTGTSGTTGGGAGVGNGNGQ